MALDTVTQGENSISLDCVAAKPTRSQARTMWHLGTDSYGRPKLCRAGAL